MMLAVISVGAFTSCSSDDDDERNNFDYPMYALYGTWETTRIGGMDVSGFLGYEYRSEITFYEDGTYYGRGYLGTGRGTYTTDGKIIKTYVNGEEYLTYVVSELSEDGKSMKGTMYAGSESKSFEAKKKE